ncbi:MAG: hypothetical protein Q9213_005886 [Squamulea squamosa]
MDYLCELPNDASRRKALGSLPPTLNATYERILRRVNASNQDVQSLVARSLRWIICNQTKSRFTTDILCEAVSINLGDTRRDAEAVPDGVDILRWCSSLVRTSEDGRCIEIAHFTVVEFLEQIDDGEDGEFAAYRVGRGHDDIELAKVCLTYLNFQEFNKQTQFSEQVIQQRFEDFPLRRYAVWHWADHASGHLDDAELYSLVQRLLSPSKPNTLISWVQDRLTFCWDHSMYADPLAMSIMDAGIAEASSLHYAAMLGFAKVCKWLIEAGCDVNRSSAFGTALYNNGLLYDRAGFLIGDDEQSVVNIFLQAGADPNHYISTPVGQLSPLFLGLFHCDISVAMDLLKMGAMIDERCLALLENDLYRMVDIGHDPHHWDKGDLEFVIKHIESKNVEACHFSRYMEIVTEANNGEGIDDGHETNDAEVTENEKCLWNAAEFGQTEVITRLLEAPRVKVQAVEKETGFTALHYAAMHDHLSAMKLLLAHGAEFRTTDHLGKNSVHHAVSSNGTDCLAYLLEVASNDLVSDNEGLNMWHLAALKKDKRALEVLAKDHARVLTVDDSRTKSGWSPLLCAAFVGSTENIDWLLEHGCKVMDTAKDGSTALHQAAKSRNLHAIRALLDNGAQINAVTEDGSTVLHFALLHIGEETSGIVSLLIERGVNVSKARHDGITSVHILVNELDIIDPSLDWRKGTETTGGSNGHQDSSDDNDESLEELFDKNGLYEELMNNTQRILRIFELLSVRMDLSSKDPTGKSVFQMVTDIWQRSCAKHVSAHSRLYLNCIASMMHIAMRRVSESPEYGQVEAIGDSLIEGRDVDSLAVLLQIAAQHGHIETAQLLLNCRASPNSTNNQFGTSLHFAAWADQIAMTELLMDNGANVNALDVELMTPSIVAAVFGSLGSLQVLIARGADLQIQDHWGNTVLHHAASSCPMSMIYSLMAASQDLDLGHENMLGYSPLLILLSCRSWQTILSIINFAPTFGAYTPRAGNILSQAVRNPEMTVSLLKKLLRRLPPSLTTTLLMHQDKFFGTPLYTASTVAPPLSHIDMISTLLEAGANLDQEGGRHGSPLMGACAAGRLVAVKFLLSKGAKIAYERDGEIISALDAAKHFPEIVRWILVERFTMGPKWISNDSGM